MELSELEQTHAIQSASQILQHIIQQNEIHTNDKNHEYELLMRKVLYDNSISQVIADNDANRVRERMLGEENMLALRNKAKQDELQSKCLYTFSHPFFSSSTLILYLLFRCI